MSTVVVELYEALKQAGVNEALARDAASAVVPVNYLAGLATKRDLTDLGALTKRDIEGLGAATKRDIEELRAAFKFELNSEISNVRRDMAEMKAELIKWNVGAMAIMTAIFAAIARLT